MAAHQTAVAAGLFAVLVLIYLWPALVGGGVLTSTSLLYQWAPWQQAMPADMSSYYNLALSDVPMSYLPWDVLARDLIRSGTFPAWNQHALAGTPLFANASVAWLSPFSVPLWVFPLKYGLGVAAAAKLWAAAFGTYLLVRELRLGFWPGIVAGTSFALCSFDVVWLSHGAHVSAGALLPWLLWLTERIMRDRRLSNGIPLALLVAVTQFSGHPGTQLHVLAFTLLYAIGRAVAVRDAGPREILLRLGTIVASLASGTLVAAVVLLPAQLAAAGTAGEVARRNGASALPGSTLPLEAMRAVPFPDWWGRPSENLIRGPANYNERALYGGAVATVLALVALLAPDGWPRKAPFVALGAVGLAVAFDLAPMRDLFNALPLFDHVQNQRLLLWFLLAIAVLAAFGLERVLSKERQWPTWTALAGAGLVAIAGLSALQLEGGDVGDAFHRLTSRFAATTDGALALASVLRWILLAGVLAGLCLLVRRQTRHRAAIGAAIALLAAIDMLSFAAGYQPITPSATAFPPRTPAIAFLQRRIDEGRIVGTGYALASDWSTTYGLRDARGYDAPQPSLRYLRLWRALNQTQQGWQPLDLRGVASESAGILGALGVRYVVTEPKTLLDEGRSSRLRSAYSGTDAKIYRNEVAAPRVVVARDVVLAADEDEEFAGVVADGFDPRRTVVARTDDLPPGVAADQLAGAGSAHVVDEENARVTIRTETDAQALVMLGDAWAPGWKVTVDGRPARQVRSDLVMRGVVVPAGVHEVEWSYSVPGLRAGAVASTVGVVVLLAWAGAALVSRRRTQAR
ncbi:hypothetical protein VSS74_09295 [Conexibacter stalactiti]|uniref:YfhO family protein n=1 Tax=Conexibacter stalactiti TaxID=1940611 RepID=A0ABU4HPP2_9ACTN|nr:hypothetical protein [Conexibacter stalactiti]MDW5594530.1 hypothetical protein [Conexibacter stalactiti]MEC5035172.1 hypothetical protein [Conexibacter stalactiti]